MEIGEEGEKAVQKKNKKWCIVRLESQTPSSLFSC